jgi:hypothetical protein
LRQETNLVTKQFIGISFTMMFAGHSARLLAATTLRSAACKKQLSSTSTKLALRLRSNCNRTSSTHRHKSTLLRNKSTAAALADDDYGDVLNGNSSGHAAAMEARVSMDKSHEEAWMINLGRGNDNEWLSGPRPQEWFTGLPPSKCPGK